MKPAFAVLRPVQYVSLTPTVHCAGRDFTVRFARTSVTSIVQEHATRSTVTARMVVRTEHTHQTTIHASPVRACAHYASQNHIVLIARGPIFWMLDNAHDSTERTRIATVLVVLPVTVIVIFIVIAVLVMFFRKRRCVMKKEKSIVTELSVLENEPVELTSPLSTKDEYFSSVKAEFIDRNDEIFSKSTSEHDDDDISDIDEDAVVLLPSEDVIPCQNLENMSEEAP